MAGKSRRVASRHAQLTRRKKRQQRGPSGIPIDEREPVTVGVATGEDVSAGSSSDESLPGTVSRSTASAAAQTTPAPTARSPIRSSSRSRGERPSAYTYVVPELRRILIMGVTGFAVLVVLKFVL
jgi:hypothetical protein